MKRFSLLFLVFLPLAANGDVLLEDVVCFGHGNSTATGNYEANICRLRPSSGPRPPPYPAAPLTTWPGNSQTACMPLPSHAAATAPVPHPASLAVPEGQRACPYHKEVEFFNGECSLQLHEILYDLRLINYIFLSVDVVDATVELGTKRQVDGVVDGCGERSWGSLHWRRKQASCGLGAALMSDRNFVMRNLSMAMVFQAIGFGWLFFLLLQESRDRKKGSMMRSSSPPSEDK